ncbi:MAG: T9SS type A sorting domain-containing protein [Bacteroidia bacterium]|nr:T9SS type A sorting domain-containing protein [Bacteroidia bacterium]
MKNFGGSGNQNGRKVIQTSDGCFAILTSEGTTVCGLLKTTANGDSLWSKLYYGTPHHKIYFNYFQQTADSGFIFCGLFGDPDSIPFPLYTSNIYLLKTNKYGDSLWSKIYDLSPLSDWPNYIEETSDGGFILTGYYNYEDNSGSDILFMKTNSTGDSLWTKIYGNPGQVWDVGNWIYETPDGGYLAGVSNPACSLMKLNSSGDTLWTKVILNDYKAVEFSKCSDGGLIMLSGIWISSENRDIRVIKIDSFGNIQWDKLYGCAGYDASYDITQTFDGGFMVLVQKSCSPATFLYLMKIDSYGDTLWSKAFPQNYLYPISFLQTQDSGFILTGSYYNGTDYDILLIKTDSAGNSPASINEIFEKEQILFYPNPFDNNLNIEFEIKSNADIQFAIYDNTGKEINLSERKHLMKGLYHEQINTEFYKSGLYFFVININGQIRSRKIVKLQNK